MTEDDIINTLEEIYEDEKVLDETVANNKHESKNSILKKECKIIENILVPDICDVIATNEVPTGFKQLAKRKCTVIDSEKQIVSGLVIKK